MLFSIFVLVLPRVTAVKLFTVSWYESQKQTQPIMTPEKVFYVHNYELDVFENVFRSLNFIFV